MNTEMLQIAPTPTDPMSSFSVRITTRAEPQRMTGTHPNALSAPARAVSRRYLRLWDDNQSDPRTAADPIPNVPKLCAFGLTGRTTVN